jgi:hypothetical protein
LCPQLEFATGLSHPHALRRATDRTGTYAVNTISLCPQLELATANGGYRIRVRCDVPPPEPKPLARGSFVDGKYRNTCCQGPGEPEIAA